MSLNKYLIFLLAVCFSVFTSIAHCNETLSDIVINIFDVNKLQEIENNGFSLNQTLSGKKKISNTKKLYEINHLYKSFAEVIGKPITHDPKTDQLPENIPKGHGDIPEMVRLIRNFEDKGKRSTKDFKGGYFIHHLSNNSQYPYTIEYDGDEPRHFDYRWLNSEYSYFKLVAVANRLDKIDMHPDGCGEVRFIYRLSYKSTKSRSTLPFFVNAVFQYPKMKSCSQFAKLWNVSLKVDIQKAFEELKFKQLELNFQSLRFTSGYMHDFGGQAMYMQRIFRIKGKNLVPVTLENTPNVDYIQKNPKLMQKFVEYLKQGENLKKLDEGRLIINFDEKFLTKLSISWSTLGRARTANKPYRKLFDGNEKLLNSIDISKLNYIKSYNALVERLDNLTCMGCHQSGGTAGFHVLGLAQKEFSHDFNKQELPMSPHAYAEISRKRKYIRNLIENKKPNTFRPHSIYPSAKWKEEGIPTFDKIPVKSLCPLPNSGFSSIPSCSNESEVECREIVSVSSKSSLIGECVLKQASTKKKYFAGGACWYGEINEAKEPVIDRGSLLSYNLFAFRDKFKIKAEIHSNRGGGSDEARYSCGLPKGGAPLGRRSRKCTLQEETFTQLDGFNVKDEIITLKDLENGIIPEELCANQGGNGFDMCAASGDSGACLETRVARAMLDSCYPGNYCREDYICQRFPNYYNISAKNYGRKRRKIPVNKANPSQISKPAIATFHKQNIGFCVPTYFLFNMRLDGHPSPVTGKVPGIPKFDRSNPLRGYK